MRSSRRSVLLQTVSLGVATFAFDRAVAQNYPSRPLKLILASPPGGPQDIAVRTLAERLSLAFGQPFVTENLAGGAGGTIGATVVAKAVPDGYTLLGALPAAFVAAPALYPNLGYDPARDFLPIASIFRSPQLLTIYPGLPIHSIRDLVDYAKANPGKVNYASAGYGTGTPSLRRNVSPDDRYRHRARTVQGSCRRNNRFVGWARSNGVSSGSPYGSTRSSWKTPCPRGH
jgi:tripartite-type tricarboxylate transporter receptor subunit TctC